MRLPKPPRGLSLTKRDDLNYEATYQHVPHPQRTRVFRCAKAKAYSQAIELWDFYLDNGYLPAGDEKTVYSFRDCADRLLQTKKLLKSYSSLKNGIDRVCEMPGFVGGTLGELSITAIRPNTVTTAIQAIGEIQQQAAGNRPAPDKVIGWKRAREFCDFMRQVLMLAHEDELVTFPAWKKRHQAEKERAFPEPAASPHSEKARRYSTAEASLLTSITDKVDRRYTVELLTLFCAALRSDELAKLKVRDLNFDVGSIYTTSIKGMKSREIPRLIPMHPVLRVALEWWLSDGWDLHYGRAPREEDFAFPAVKDVKKKLAWSTLNKHIGIAHREAGVERLKGRGAHGARHTFLTEARLMGVEGVARAATHGDAKRGDIADVYASPDWKAATTAIARYEWFGKLSDWQNNSDHMRIDVETSGETLGWEIGQFGEIPDLLVSSRG